MLANLSPDTGLLFQVTDTEKQLDAQQLKLGMVQALGFSLLVHFFLALFVLPALSINKPSSDEPEVLAISLIERTPEPRVLEPEKIEKKVNAETLPVSETTTEHTVPLEDQVAKEKPDSLLFPTAPESSASDMQAERIFNPRLRQQFYNSKPRQQNNEIEGHVEILGSQYYGLGKGKCLRETENYGITDRYSEEFFMFNVRNVDCPGSEKESEGEVMMRGLRAALKGD